MSIETVIEHFKVKAANSEPIGGTIKFMLDGAPIFIDGSGEENTVSGEDKDAQCTISTSTETLTKLQNGELNAMMAMMAGKIKISGDMGLAMKLQSFI